MTRADDDGLEHEADRLIAGHGGFGKDQGIYSEEQFEAQSFGVAPLSNDQLDSQPVDPLRREDPMDVLVRCLAHVHLTEAQAAVLCAVRDLCAEQPRRPTFRQVARYAKLRSSSSAWAAWKSALKKIVDWAEAHPQRRRTPEQDIIDLLIEVFGAYFVRLAGYL